MQGTRKAMGVFLMFFGIVTFTFLMTTIGSDSRAYAELDMAIGNREILSYVFLLGLSITQFILGFDLSGFLTKERKVLEKPKPIDKGTRILLYGIPVAIAIGVIIIYVLIVLPHL